MPANSARLVREKLDLLAQDPMTAQPNVKRLKGRPGYRLRVGDWRVVYELDHEGCRLIILDIEPRGSIYEQ